VLENIDTNASPVVNVHMIYSCSEGDLRGSERIVMTKSNVYMKQTSFVTAAFWSRDSGRPIE